MVDENVSRSDTHEWYAVTSVFSDSGRFHANITDMVVQAQKPKNTMVSLRNRDVYIDWFDSYEDACGYCRSCEQA